MFTQAGTHSLRKTLSVYVRLPAPCSTRLHPLLPSEICLNLLLAPLVSFFASTPATLISLASIFMRSAEGLPERGGYQSLIEGDPLRRRPPSSVRSSSHDQNVPPNLNLTQETFPFTLRGESLAAFPPLMREDVSKLLFSSHPTTTCPFGFSTSSSNPSHTQSSL